MVNSSFNLSDLNGSNGFVLNGIDAGDNSGGAVSSAGDINGDGIDDLIIGASGADANGKDSAGSSYVVFGQTGGFSTSIDLSTLNGNNGFVLNGIDAADSSGESVSSAGDINGDGIDDLIVGASQADPEDKDSAGSSYVVFGQTGGFSASLDLSDLNGSNGFVLNGIDAGDRSGNSVSSAGDINGDGIDDLIIGKYGANSKGNYNGQSYVVFGQSGGFSASIDLSDLNGSNGFVLNSIDDLALPFAVDVSVNVSSAGDINGDGIDDLIIGETRKNLYGKSASRKSYVVFGQTGEFSARIDLYDLSGNNGFILNGIDVSGFVSSAGDINGDGIDDLIIGASGVYLGGESYVVFGQTGQFSASVNLSDLNGSNGFVLNGIDAGDDSGGSVSSAGDINGDGIDDLIVGAPGANPNGKDSAGQSYVVFGKTGEFSAGIELSDLNGSNGFVFNGIDAGDGSGGSVSGAGDINGDGIDDLIIGATGADPEGKDSAGSSYVVFGNAPPALDLNASAAGIDFTTTFTGSGVAIVNSANLTLADPNSTKIAGATVEITNLLDGADEVLAADTTGTKIGANYNSATGTLTLSGADTVANYQQVLRTLTYNNTAATPDTTARTIEFVVSDGAAITSAITTTTLAFIRREPNASLNLSDLNGSNGFVLNGSGSLVSSAGDINGDGIDDLIIARAVVFGQTGGFSASIDLCDLNGSNGFVFNGINDSDYLGSSVSSAGDINGDGIDDLIIGASGAAPNGKYSAGQSYVVFGKTGRFSASLDLSTLNGSNGFVLNGIDAGDGSGDSVSSAGDINNDGIDDLIIGAYLADPNGKFNAGESYVVFGQTGGFSASLDLSTLNGSNGFVLNGIDAGDFSGGAVSSAGDINGDGIDDLIIGAFVADPNGKYSAGQSYVVFGQSEGFSASLDLSTLNGSNGFVLNGIDAEDFSGIVSSAGDINGDGIDDLIIGASGADPNGKYFAGESYVVFGQTGGFSASLDLSTLNGSNGFVLNGDVGDISGRSVSGAGDINGDGIDDLIIGAYRASPNGKDSAGQSYVVFGRTGEFSASLDLSTLNGSNGFVLNGIDAGDFSGGSVSGAGDINGDGIDDLIIGASGADPNGKDSAGQSYVVFGNARPALDLNGGAADIDFTTNFAGSAVAIVNSPNLTLADSNSTKIAGATVKITNLLDGADEFLAADTTSTKIAANYNSATGILTLSGAATVDNYQQVLRTLTYNNAAATPDTTARTIELVIDDGATQSNTSAVATTTLTFFDNIIDGTPGKDVLIGKRDDDLIDGFGGNDILSGGAGDDLLNGGSSKDVLRGGFGDDLLSGGAGNDKLFGGAGADQFLLKRGQGKDTSADFKDGQDSFLLANGLEFEELTITRRCGQTEIASPKGQASFAGIAATDEVLASLIGVQANVIGLEDFTTVV